MLCVNERLRSTVLTVLRSIILSLMLLCSSSISATAGLVTFGTDVNTFTMEFVEIGNPGNADDTTGDPNPAGSVAYTYQMGKYEVSRDMITKYNSEFGTTNSLEITMWDMTSIGANGADKPATGVHWNEAARFVNWLNTSTGGFAAYNFTTGGVNDDIAPWTDSDTLDYDASNPYRSLRATYVLPSMDEWYKAAYYDPVNDAYYDFPTGSDTAPTAVASGTDAGTAVYAGLSLGAGVPQTGPADITLAGGLSPYGIMGMGGNVWEWEETALSLDNSSGSSERALRGGNWFLFANELSSSTRLNSFPLNDNENTGFRVASVTPVILAGSSVPEPGSMALLLGGVLVFGYRRLRK